MPAAGFYLGELLGLAALAYGLAWWLRRGERAVPAALAVAAALYAYAHFAGTPYQAAKSILIASPLAMLIAARALLSGEPAIPLNGLRGVVARRRGGAVGVWARWEPRLRPLLAAAFLAAAVGCSLLALANGPVGPATYAPAAHRAPAGSARAPPSSSSPSTCSPTSTAATTSSGSCEGAASASTRSGPRPPRRRPTARRT